MGVAFGIFDGAGHPGEFTRGAARDIAADGNFRRIRTHWKVHPGGLIDSNRTIDVAKRLLRILAQAVPGLCIGHVGERDPVVFGP